jgi:hypothetical protein
MSVITPRMPRKVLADAALSGRGRASRAAADSAGDGFMKMNCRADGSTGLAGRPLRPMLEKSRQQLAIHCTALRHAQPMGNVNAK